MFIETIKRQIERCNLNKNNDNFASSVEALFNMLLIDMRSEIEKKGSIYKETPIRDSLHK
jgi:Rod binding domain-containing protein